MNRDGIAATSKVPEVTLLFWILKIFATTLGETGGDSVSMSMNLGYLVATGIFGGLLLVTAMAYRWTRVSHTLLFWAAFVLTRPLGAVVGDFLDKPIAKGGLAWSRYGASAALLAVIVVLILAFKQRPAREQH